MSKRKKWLILAAVMLLFFSLLFIGIMNWWTAFLESINRF